MVYTYVKLLFTDQAGTGGKLPARLLLCFIGVLFLQGCVVGARTPQGRTSTYVGFVQVRNPPTIGNLSALQVKTLGLAWDQGPLFGWRDKQLVTADPRQCQLVIIIRRDAEMQNASKLIKELKGENVCLADFTGSPPLP